MEENWLDMRLRAAFLRLKQSRAVRKLCKHVAILQKFGDQGLPYLTRYKSLSRPAAPPPKVSDFPGLIFIQYSDLSDKTEISAYWRSRETALASINSFMAKAGAESVLSEGYLRHIAGPAQIWWQRVPLGRWFLYVSSFVGALTVLQAYFAKSFERPDIGPEISGSQVLNILASDEINFDLSITNRSRDVQSVVTLSKPIVKTSVGGLVVHNFQCNLRPAPIAPSTTTTIPFVGDPLPVGLYAVSIKMKARTGYFPGELPFETTKKMRVWPLEPSASLVAIKKLRNPFGARAEGQLLIGAPAPNGLQCRATIKNSPNVKVPFVDFPGVFTRERLPDALTPGLERISYAFESSRAFASLSRYSFYLTLESGVRGTDWEQVKTRTSVVCTRKEGKEAAK